MERLTSAELREQANLFISTVSEMEMEQGTSIKTREFLENSINELVDKNKDNKEV